MKKWELCADNFFEKFSCLRQGGIGGHPEESREGCLVLRQQIRIAEELVKDAGF